ncbi:hypothetical protein B7P43_G00653 [Cryptotermes secundus]|uniref:Uncharacterized protein n=1 Tax=Cryptotermes secundus TaxID=105785 RepID=A0A2J7RIR7_9NEOP|nr:hypothetical protein B7P43_G00653 [Cryptotermes secundus]
MSCVFPNHVLWSPHRALLVFFITENLKISSNNVHTFNLGFAARNYFSDQDLS